MQNLVYQLKFFYELPREQIQDNNKQFSGYKSANYNK